MSTVILSGTTLLEYVQQARNVCGPDFPIIGLNRQYHIEPSKTFNSLPHTEVDFLVEQSLHFHQNFNSLPHTEVDCIGAMCVCSGVDISTHYLTQRQTGFSVVDGDMKISSTHYLTQRQTVFARYSIAVEFNFNSLPHTEVDHLWCKMLLRSDISTHYLTQRQTPPDLFPVISSVFQLTTSHRGRPSTCSPFCGLEYFNSLPHTEVDL